MMTESIDIATVTDVTRPGPYTLGSCRHNASRWERGVHRPRMRRSCLLGGASGWTRECADAETVILSAKIDQENDGWRFWSAARDAGADPFPGLGKIEIVLNAREASDMISAWRSLDGWCDGPDYARHPIITSITGPDCLSLSLARQWPEEL